MSRCSRCNRALLLASRSGYCMSCLSLAIRQEKEMLQKAEEELLRQKEARMKAEAELRQQIEAGQRAEEDLQRYQISPIDAVEERSGTEVSQCKNETLPQHQEEDIRRPSKVEECKPVVMDFPQNVEETEASSSKVAALLRRPNDAWKAEFATSACQILREVHNRVNQGLYNDEVLKMLRCVMIYANESSSEFIQAQKLHTIVKHHVTEAQACHLQTMEENKRKEIERRSSNMNGIHIGLICRGDFYDSHSNLRAYAFIQLIDGYSKTIFDSDEYDLHYEDDLDNVNWIDEEEFVNRPYRSFKNVFFHISDAGQGNIRKAIEALRSNRDWQGKYEVCVVYRISSAKKGKKAVNVITLEDALADNNTLAAIRKMITSDINVYFFLMEHSPGLFAKFFSGVSFEGIWNYQEFCDHIVLEGTNLKQQTQYAYPTNRKYHFPSSVIVLPDAIRGKPVTAILDSAFAHDDGIRKVIVPDTVIEIGKGVFENCTCLDDIHLPASLHSIKARTFAECACLKTITIPSRLVEIGEQAFSGSGLEAITLPVSVTSISEDAFANCNAIVRKRLK